MKRLAWLLAGTAATLLACTQAAPPRTPVPIEPLASLQDLMNAVIDPAADGVWEAVSEEATAAGAVVHAPRDEAEWAVVRQHAVRLVESAHLLLVPGRAIVAPGRKVEDAHVSGISDAAAIEHAIAADRGAFAAAVQRLHTAAAGALAAVDRRDTQALLAAGERVEQACESCHRQYWYPGAPPPPPAPPPSTDSTKGKP